MLKKFCVALCLGLASLLGAAAQVVPQALILRAEDGVTVFAELRRAEHPKAVLLLFHQAGGSLAEYAEIAPRLVQAGFTTLAIDQRSGGKQFVRENETVKRLGKSGTYLSALKDLEAALAWAQHEKLPVAVWGSSYSSSLVFLLAQQHPKDIAAVLSFSPGEYLGTEGMVQKAASAVTVPVYVTQAKDAEELAAAKAIFNAVPAAQKNQFVPQLGGVHGSSTLRSARNPKGEVENWAAVLGFLQAVFPG